MRLISGVIAWPFDSAATALPWKQSPPSTTSVCSGFCFSQGVDHRAQRGEPAASFESRPAVFVEELVVNLELRVNVGGVQDREVLRFPALHGRGCRRDRPHPRGPAGMRQAPDRAPRPCRSTRSAAGSHAGCCTWTLLSAPFLVASMAGVRTQSCCLSASMCAAGRPVRLRHTNSVIGVPNHASESSAAPPICVIRKLFTE